MSSHTCLVTIDALSHGPAGIGHVGNKVVFVPGTVPGDEVEIVIETEKKRYATGQVVHLRRPSTQRRIPPCPYVSRCGGCPWQQVKYAEQLRAKEITVREQLRRIGGIADPPMLPIIPASDEWHYRHRIRLHQRAGQWGFFSPQSHDIVAIEACLIAQEEVSAQVQVARKWGSLLQTHVRHIEIVGAESFDTTPASCIFVGEADGIWQSQDADRCARFLFDHPQISGLLLFGHGWQRKWGKTEVAFVPEPNGDVMLVNEGTFTQVNPTGNQALIANVLALGNFHSQQKVIDLYCGAGNVSVPIARRVHSLIGIEKARAAVEAAHANASRAGLTNTQFITADAEAGVQRLIRDGVRGDVVVLDPPRTGAAAVMRLLPRLGVTAVLYISCDPATLARDLRHLHARGYHLQAVQPLDLFPQTYHVETIALSLLTC